MNDAADPQFTASQFAASCPEFVNILCVIVLGRDYLALGPTGGECACGVNSITPLFPPRHLQVFPGGCKEISRWWRDLHFSTTFPAGGGTSTGGARVGLEWGGIAYAGRWWK